MAVQQVQTLDEYEKLLTENTFVATDFYADWCPPCKAISPMFSSLASAKTIPGHLVFAKVNVDYAPDIAQKYGITAMPTFLFFEKGKPYSGRSMIRGADPRGLQAVIASMATAAEAAAKSAGPRPAAEPAESGDEPTVSGGYTMSQGAKTRPDWKMSLNG
jgi:thioredoxin 1